MEPAPLFPAATIIRLLRFGVLVGAIVWPLWWVLGGAGPTAMDELHFALAGGITVITPLALLLTSEPDRRGRALTSWVIAAALWPFAGAGALFALTLAPGTGAALLTAPWLIVTGSAGLYGLQRLGRRARPPLAEVALDVGLLWLAAGGVWLLASRAGHGLLGWSEPWVALTAAHFHVAGLGLLLLTGLASRALADLDTRNRGIWALGAGLVLCALLGMPLTAYGIAGAPTAELVGAALIGVAAVGTGGVMAVLALLGRVPPEARITMLVAGLTPVATMALAGLWAVGEWTGAPSLIPMDAMVRWHGLPNVILFVAGGLTGFALATPSSRVPAPGIPLSGLRAGGHVGRFWFRETDAVDRDAPIPTGTVPDLGAFARSGVEGLNDLDAATVHPAVRRSYERTADYAMEVTARWRLGWRTAGRLYGLIARSLGQLELPFQVTDSALSGELVALKAGFDSRGPSVGWVRCHPSGRPVYVAAYARHEDRGVPYMNIAFPLPGACFHSVLRLDPVPDGGLRLTTRPPESRRIGDEGLYLTTPLGALRLPLHEELVAVASAGGGPGATVTVTQHVWIVGIRFLTMTFRLTPSASRDGRTS